MYSMKNTMKNAFNDLLNIMQLDKARTPSFEERDIPPFLINEGGINIETKNILDVLGEYDPEKKRVIVYPQYIEIFASKLRISSELLYEIVLYHELAHAATHLGCDANGGIWDSFGYEDPSVIEYFAQIYAYLLLLQNKSCEAIDAMKRISECQPGIYKKYLDDINKNISDINLALLKARGNNPIHQQPLISILGGLGNSLSTNAAQGAGGNNNILTSAAQGAGGNNNILTSASLGAGGNNNSLTSASLGAGGNNNSSTSASLGTVVNNSLTNASQGAGGNISSTSASHKGGTPNIAVGRGLSPDFIKDLIDKNSGWLKEILAYVKKDNTLDLEIRKNYIDIYYRGGKILEITERGKCKKNSEKIKYKDSKYTYEYDEKYLKNLAYSPGNALNTYIAVGEWNNYFPMMKQAMDFHFSTYAKEEREYQQLVVRENNYSSIANSTDYFIIDVEYQFGNKFRFDLIAVEWPTTSRRSPKKPKLIIIEMKYGDGSLKNGSGIVKHCEDYNAFISIPQRVDDFKEEMHKVYQQKRDLDLELIRK